MGSRRLSSRHRNFVLATSEGAGGWKEFLPSRRTHLNHFVDAVELLDAVVVLIEDC